LQKKGARHKAEEDSFNLLWRRSALPNR
jgi:hypothetical protein